MCNNDHNIYRVYQLSSWLQNVYTIQAIFEQDAHIKKIINYDNSYVTSYAKTHSGLVS